MQASICKLEISLQANLLHNDTQDMIKYPLSLIVVIY